MPLGPKKNLTKLLGGEKSQLHLCYYRAKDNISVPHADHLQQPLGASIPGRHSVQLPKQKHQ